jgi:flagellar protein FlgJ
MDKLAQSPVSSKDSSYYDFAELDKLRSAKGNDQAALKSAAKQFESIFTQMLLTSMRKASEVLESDSPFNSESSKFYRDMHDKQMVSSMADNGGLGLTNLIVEQLSGNNPNFKPASVLRPDGGMDGLGRIHKSSSLKFDNAEQVQMNRAPKVQNKPAEEKSSLFDDPISFIKSLLPAAQKVAENSPLQPMMLIAQAALETGWGKKVINKPDGSSSFNLFGIKAGDNWHGDKAKVQTLEYKDGVAKKENAFFRAYDSVEDSVKDYLQFVSSDDRYADAMKNAENPTKYFESLQSAGYATDPNYAKKVVKILNSDHFAKAKE